MAFWDFYNKAKKKLTDTIGGLGAVANTFRHEISDWGNKPAPNWMQKVDTGLRNFSEAAAQPKEYNPQDFSKSITGSTLGDTLLGPVGMAYKMGRTKFNFADKAKNPVSKIAASVADTTLNIPSRTASALFKDYGKTEATPSYMLKRGAEAAGVGLDIGSLAVGGGMAKNLAKEGFKNAGRATLGQVFKEGAKKGMKEGLAYGATSGALSGLQEGDNLKEQGKNALKQGVMSGVMGVGVGGVLGGGIPAVGHEVGSVIRDAKKIINPYAKRIVTKFKQEPTGAFAPGGVPQMRDIPESARKVVETIKIPFKPESATGKLLTARPGLNIEDVNMRKPRVVSSADLDASIARKKELARETVQKQIGNQKAGLGTTESGFVAPQNIKKPLPTIEEFVDGKTSKKPLPSIEEYVNGKNSKPENIAMPNDIKRLQDKVDNGEFIQPQLYKKLMAWKENPTKAVTPKDVFQTGPYNKFQQRAFEKKGDRLDAIREVLNYPTELRRIGYKKAEIDRIGKDQADRILKMSGLGYPKNEIQKMDFDRMDLIIKRQVPWESLKKYYERKHALDTNFLEGVDPAELKDINPLMAGGRDVYRNFEVAFGNNYPKIKSQLLDPFDQAKGSMFSEQEQLANELNENIVKKFGITKGSKMSEYVQKWGEGKFIRPLEESDIPDTVKLKINFEELKSLAEKTAKGDWTKLVAQKLEKFPEEKRQVILSQLQQSEPNNWQKVIEADQWFRNKYETLLGDLNKVREENFPTHPLFPESTKVIPFRKDYYRHFKDNEGFAGLKNMFETPASIDPALAASSDMTNPKTKWLSFAQRRKGDKTEYDAVGGYLDYLRNHAYAKHIDPFIQKFKGIDEEAKQGLPTGSFFHETRGLSEELSQKMDPIQQITDATDQAKIQKILLDHGMSDRQSEWMSKELAGINNYDKVKNFIKNKTAKNKENILGKMEPKAMAEGSDNQENNFLVFIKNFSRDLAGKTNPVDRPFQENIFGRKALNIINWANSRFKANAVLGNASSSLAQFFNIPQGFASAGVRNSAKGLGSSLADIFRKNSPINESSFIRERYFHGFDKFDEGILNNTKKFAVWMTGVGDKVGTRFIWNSHYQKALSEGIANPVKYADDWTRKMVAGRGIGEVPIVQKSKMMQIAAPFQLEVANQWYALKDLAKNDPSKLVMAKKLLEFSVASYLMNRVVKEIRGSDVSFDPINAMAEAYGEYQKEDDKVKGFVKAGGRVAGEVFSNMPGGQTLASMYPEYGFGINKENFPTLAKALNNPRKDFFGEGDPTRFGTGGLPLFSAIKNPLTGFVLPYGGKQIEKMYSGVKTLAKGYAENNSGKVMTPVERNIPNVMRGVLFGKNATSEVQDYFNNNETPLSDLQTEKYKLMGNDFNYFDKISAERKADNEREAMKGGKPMGESKLLSEDVIQLSNGKIYVKSLDREFKNEKEAGMAIAMEDLASSDENFRDLNNGWVLRKGEDGNVVKQRRDSYDAGLNTARMSGYKKNDDLKSWKATADKQLELLNKMMADPSIDDFDKAKIQNAMDTLISDYQKFAEYGGFKKGSKGRKLEEKFRYPLVDPEFMKISLLLAGGGKRKPIIPKRGIPITRRAKTSVRRRRLLK